MAVLGQPVTAGGSMVTGVALTGDSVHAVTGQYDGVVRIWDMRKQSCVLECGGVGSKQCVHSPVTGVAAAPRSSSLVLASHADGRVHVSTCALFRVLYLNPVACGWQQLTATCSFTYSVRHCSAQHC